jgi:hypothetical protein
MNKVVKGSGKVRGFCALFACSLYFLPIYIKKRSALNSRNGKKVALG